MADTFSVSLSQKQEVEVIVLVHHFNVYIFAILNMLAGKIQLKVLHRNRDVYMYLMEIQTSQLNIRTLIRGVFVFSVPTMTS